MNEYVIVTDSCIDLPNDLVKKLGLVVIPLSVTIENEEYFNYLDEREITFKQFYQNLREHRRMHTSQVNVDRFITILTPILEAGKDILHICFSSALSGTYNALLVAKEMLEEQFPNQKIIAIDSLSASMGQGLLVNLAAKEKQKGKTLDEVAEFVENTKLNLCHLFTVGDLDHLRRGGRLSSAKAILGTILRIKPLLHVSKEGKLVQTGKTRGRRTSLDTLVDTLVHTITNPEGQQVFISHGDCLEDAEYVRDQIKSKLPITDFTIHYVGPVIGCHSGLGTVAIFYLGTDRFANE
ncbi:MAG: DegV family protein [Bacilli bacterium]|jgi:DegV family protein with EDD domain|nr:DegV family protein [Bacilli bacterium]